MYPQGAHPSLMPSLSRPRVVPIPASLPVPLHVTSSRKVHRSADGTINIIQEISFYAEGGVKSVAGKQLKEVHSQPTAQVRGRFSAETNTRVFVGERIIRMLIQTSIRPNTSDSLEIDEVFHFAETQDAEVVPIAFEATLEREEGENPAVEFDLSSAIIVTLKQRILKDPGEQYKVLQAIELRANESETRPTQELARKTTITQPTNDSAQFRERIFAGTDVLRVDRDIIFVCNRPVLSLSERREYMPSAPMAPRRRSASLTQSVPRVSYSPTKARSRSQSRSGTEDSENLHTADEDLPTATSPYSLREDESNSCIPPCSGLRTARVASPANSAPRSSRSQCKKWTVNSAQARTPNGEIAAVQAMPIMPTHELGPHGESQLVAGMEGLRVVAPADSLIRTCAEGHSPTRTRSASNCSTAGEIPTCASVSNHACQSPPFSSPRAMPRTGESSAVSSRPCTPLRTGRGASPSPQKSAPSSAALDKRRGLFGYGTRAVTPTRSARLPPNSSPALNTCIKGPSPMRSAQQGLSPVQTAVHVKSNGKSQKSQKQSHKESKRSGRSGKRNAASPRLISVDPPSAYRTPSTANLATARNLFGTVATNESVARMGTARTSDPRTAASRSSRSSGLTTARGTPLTDKADQPLRIDREQWDDNNRGSMFGKHGETEQNYPFRPIALAAQGIKASSSACSPATPHTGRLTSNSTDRMRTAAERASATLAVHHSPTTRRDPQPRMLFGDILTSPPGAVPPVASSTYEKNLVTGRESRSPIHSLKTARQSPYDKSVRSPALYTAELSPYEQNVQTARASRSPAHSIKTARNSPYEKTARERSHVSPARGLPTARGVDRSPASLKTAARTPRELTARSPAAGMRTAAEYGRSPMAPPTVHPIGAGDDDGAYVQVVTARVVSPYPPRGLASPLRPSMTARDQTSARSPMVTSRTQSPATRSAFSNMVTAQGPRSPHVDTGSPNNLTTAREHRSVSGTGRERSQATSKPPPVIVRASQANGKIYVDMCLSFKLNTTGTIRVRGEMVPALTPRTVSVNGQQIWSDPSRH